MWPFHVIETDIERAHPVLVYQHPDLHSLVLKIGLIIYSDLFAFGYVIDCRL